MGCADFHMPWSYFASVVTTNCATALNVVCAAFKPSLKSLSLNVEKTSIG
jgi:hypothetical protein